MTRDEQIADEARRRFIPEDHWSATPLLRGAFYEGGRWADSHPADKWVRVEDGLPEKHQRVLWIADHGDWAGQIMAGNYLGDELGFPEFSCPGLGMSATHWQLLPEAPDG